MSKVSILVTTYNGEKYLAEQIDSLINQSYKDIEIYISDDGSSDGTMQILQDFARHDKRIHIQEGKHAGACQNFANLLKEHKDDDYVMLCDQDDVWDLQKVEKTLNKMQLYEKKSTPILVYSGRLYVDENLQPMSMQSADFEDTLKSLLCINHIYGCTMMLNNALLSKIDIPEYATMHDHWIALVVALFGKIIKIDEPLMLYRQHSGNVTGGLNQFSLKKKIANWKKTNENLEKEFLMCYKFCKENCNLDNDTILQYLYVMQSTGIKRLYKALLFGYKRNRLIATIRGLIVLLNVEVMRVNTNEH